MEIRLYPADYYRRLYNTVTSKRTKEIEVITKKEEIVYKIYSKLINTIYTFPEDEIVNMKLTKITKKNVEQILNPHLDNTLNTINIQVDVLLIPKAKSIIKELFNKNVGITKTGLITFKEKFTIDDIKDAEFKKILFNKINEVNLNKIISNLNEAISLKKNYIIINVTSDMCWDLLKTKLYKLRYIIEDNIKKDNEEGIVKISF